MGGGGGGLCWEGGASEIRHTWGGACPKSLKTPDLQYTYSINQSIGDRGQRIREACCRCQTGPGVAPCKRRCWEGVFSCGTEQNQKKKQPSIGWHLVINNDHKDGQSGAMLQMGAPSDIIKTSKKATGQYNHAHRS